MKRKIETDLQKHVARNFKKDSSNFAREKQGLLLSPFRDAVNCYFPRTTTFTWGWNQILCGTGSASWKEACVKTASCHACNGVRTALSLGSSSSVVNWSAITITCAAVWFVRRSCATLFQRSNRNACPRRTLQSSTLHPPEVPSSTSSSLSARAASGS